MLATLALSSLGLATTVPASALSLISDQPTSVGYSSDNIAFSSDGKVAFIQHGEADYVTIVNAKNSRVISDVTIGSYVNYVTPIPESTQAYAIYAGHYFALIDSRKRKVVDRFNLPREAGVCRIDLAAQLIVCVDGGPPFTLRTYSLRNHRLVGTTSVQHFADDIDFSPKGSTAFVTSANGGQYGYVTVVKLSTAKVLAVIDAGREPLRSALTPDGKFLYTVDYMGGAVTVIDTKKLSVIATIPVGDNYPASVAISLDGTTAYVPVFVTGQIIAIDVNTNTIKNNPLNIEYGIYNMAINPNGSGGLATVWRTGHLYSLDMR